MLRSLILLALTFFHMIWAQSTAPPACNSADLLTIPITVRDMHIAGPTWHPDFQNVGFGSHASTTQPEFCFGLLPPGCNIPPSCTPDQMYSWFPNLVGCPTGCTGSCNSGFGWVRGLVSPVLGADRTPVWAPLPGTSIHSNQSFYAWYHDSAISFRYNTTLTLQRIAPNSPVFSYYSSNFFPLDGVPGAFGSENVAGTNGHDFGFTTEIHSTFTFQGTETFTFNGDDDVWVFMNNQLVVDIGGVHAAVCGSVNLTQLATGNYLTVTGGPVNPDNSCPNTYITSVYLPLKIGNSYPIDIFQAERHTVQSNFRMATSISFETKATASAVAKLSWSSPYQVYSNSLNAFYLGLYLTDKSTATFTLILSTPPTTAVQFYCVDTNGFVSLPVINFPLCYIGNSSSITVNVNVYNVGTTALQCQATATQFSNYYQKLLVVPVIVLVNNSRPVAVITCPFDVCSSTSSSGFNFNLLFPNRQSLFLSAAYSTHVMGVTRWLWSSSNSSVVQFDNPALPDVTITISAVGIYNITLIVYDTRNFPSLPVTFVVLSDAPPVFSPSTILTRPFLPSASIDFTGYVRSLSNVPLSITTQLSSSPPGATPPIVQANGAFVSLTNILFSGQYLISVIATDLYGLFSTTTFTVDIQAPPLLTFPASNIQAFPVNSLSNTINATLLLTFSSLDSVFNYSLSQLTGPPLAASQYGFVVALVSSDPVQGQVNAISISVFNLHPISNSILTNYTFQIRIIDSVGQISYGYPMFLLSPYPTALISTATSYNISSGSQPLFISASKSIAASRIVSYFWSISPSTFSNSPAASILSTTSVNTTITFYSVGVYTLSLTVTDTLGLTNQASAAINVQSTSYIFIVPASNSVALSLGAVQPRTFYSSSAVPYLIVYYSEMDPMAYSITFNAQYPVQKTSPSFQWTVTNNLLEVVTVSDYLAVPSVFSHFGLGLTTIMLSSTDGAGAVSSNSITVQVRRDTIVSLAPVVSSLTLVSTNSNSNLNGIGSVLVSTTVSTDGSVTSYSYWLTTLSPANAQILVPITLKCNSTSSTNVVLPISHCPTILVTFTTSGSYFFNVNVTTDDGRVTTAISSAFVVYGVPTTQIPTTTLLPTTPLPTTSIPSTPTPTTTPMPTTPIPTTPLPTTPTPATNTPSSSTLLPTTLSPTSSATPTSMVQTTLPSTTRTLVPTSTPTATLFPTSTLFPSTSPVNSFTPTAVSTPFSTTAPVSSKSPTSIPATTSLVPTASSIPSATSIPSSMASSTPNTPTSTTSAIPSSSVNTPSPSSSSPPVTTSPTTNIISTSAQTTTTSNPTTVILTTPSAAPTAITTQIPSTSNPTSFPPTTTPVSTTSNTVPTYPPGTVFVTITFINVLNGNDVGWQNSILSILRNFFNIFDPNTLVLVQIVINPNSPQNLHSFVTESFVPKMHKFKFLDNQLSGSQTVLFTIAILPTVAVSTTSSPPPSSSPSSSSQTPSSIDLAHSIAQTIATASSGTGSGSVLKGQLPGLTSVSISSQPPTPTSSPNGSGSDGPVTVTLIIIIVVAGVVGLIIIILICLACTKRRQLAQERNRLGSAVVELQLPEENDTDLNHNLKQTQDEGREGFIGEGVGQLSKQSSRSRISSNGSGNTADGRMASSSVSKVTFHDRDRQGSSTNTFNLPKNLTDKNQNVLDWNNNPLDSHTNRL